VTLRAALLLAAALLIGCPKGGGGKSDQVVGVVQARLGEQLIALPQAQVSVRPSGNEDLVGTAITNDEGQFLITELFSRTTYEPSSLQRDTTYEVTVQAVGYYLLTQPLEHAEKVSELTLILEPKGMDVRDDSGVDTDVDSSGMGGQGGKAPIRGN
jgi:hypothetical protein